MKDRQGNVLTRGDIITVFPDPHYDQTYIKAIYIGSTEVSNSCPTRYKVEYVPISTIGLNTLKHLNGQSPDYFKASKWYILKASKLQLLKVAPSTLIGKELDDYTSMIAIL